MTIGAGDKVLFRAASQDEALTAGIVFRDPWGRAKNNLSIRTLEGCPRTFVRLTGDVEVTESAAALFERLL
jgi:hypothetical protein